MNLLADMPRPTYPEYEQLRAAAAAAAQRPVSPASIPVKRALITRRGFDWCLAVVGRPCHGLGSISCVDAELLVLADAADIDPPLPQWVVDERAAAARVADERAAERKARDDADQAAWDATRAGLTVEVQVLRNGHARPRHGYAHHLGHVVPKVDAESGPDRRPRRHRAGRALCESERRARPLDLSGGEGGAATCVACLAYTPKIRPTDMRKD